MKKLATIILAAGNSSRLGQAKQNLILNDKSLLTHSIELAQSVSDLAPLVVLGFEPDLFIPTITKPARYCINTYWQQGMTSSIQCGLKAIDTRADAALILTVDQWQLNTSDMTKLKRIWLENPNKNVASSYASTIGIPVIFTQTFFSSIIARTDTGAKPELIASKPITVELPNATVDLDTPEDLQTFNSKTH